MRIISTVLLVLSVSSCSTFNKVLFPNSNNDIKHLQTKGKHVIKQHPLCTYRENKGIAELSAIKDKIHYFIFYPGDDVFELYLEEELSLGSEYHAIKNSLISGHKGCQKIEVTIKP